MGSLHSMTDEPGIIQVWPPHLNLGQLVRLTPSSELPVGSAEASTEIALQQVGAERDREAPPSKTASEAATSLNTRN